MVPFGNAAVSDTVINHVCPKDCGLEFCAIGVLGAVKTGLKHVNATGTLAPLICGSAFQGFIYIQSVMAQKYEMKIPEISPKF